MVDDNKLGRRAAADASTVRGDPGTAATEAADRGDFLPFELPPPGYQLGTLLGKGGMGEVILAQDQRVGREVAYKRMRKADAGPEALGRFLREARIQARLDHPAIVPVYELGKDTEGRPFFTMKRLAGKTLTDLLARPDEPRQPLLRAFAEVCLAVELAHSKGVVHRDLKPSNIMLGDFGEVYVLDWGIARVLTDRKRRPTDADQGDIDSIGEATSDGTMLGTLGYMSPEQMRGEEIGPPTDVYALGAILFEILAGEPLHPRGHPAVSSTLAMETASPRERRPEQTIPPELDKLCSDALQADASRRPTARDMATRIQSYLDGDRDLERRRVLAAQYLASARAFVDSGDPNRRADALRDAGRALALDAGSTEAADLVTSLIIEPPVKLPAELSVTLELDDVDASRNRARKAMTSYALLMLLSAFLIGFEVKNWNWLVAIYAGMAGFTLLSWRTYKTGVSRIYMTLVGTAVMAVLFSRLSSPFVLVPVLMCGTAMAICNHPLLIERRWILYLWMAACATLPPILEWTGVIMQTTRVDGGYMVIESAIFETGSRLNLAALFAGNALFLLVVTRFAVLLARDRRTAQRQLRIQAWHLRQLLPKTPGQSILPAHG